MAFKKGFKTSYNMDKNKYDTWSTPLWLFNSLNKRFKFTLDVCASRKNAKCKRYYTKKDNALNKKWRGACFCNPPYGTREIDMWMEKAYQSGKEGATVVCLVPSATSTNWWHKFAMKGQIEFIKGKIRFIKNGIVGDPSPFHSAIVIFRGK